MQSPSEHESPMSGEVALRQRIAALESEVQTLRDEMQAFSYTVSHDLRASVRHILSYAQLVQEDAAPQLSTEVQGFLHTITDSAQHMAAMLDGLRELARIGSTPLQPERIALHPLLDEVRSNVLAQHPERSVQWQISQQLAHIQVQADAVLLRLVLQQVLDNALKFTRPQAVAKISIYSEIQGSEVQSSGVQASEAHDSSTAANCLRLLVQDNGVGYNPAQQNKLFQPFSRLHSIRQFEGLGLGLALAHKGMARLGGSITLEGAPEHGCTARISLPL